MPEIGGGESIKMGTLFADIRGDDTNLKKDVAKARTDIEGGEGIKMQIKPSGRYGGGAGDFDLGAAEGRSRYAPAEPIRGGKGVKGKGTKGAGAAKGLAGGPIGVALMVGMKAIEKIKKLLEKSEAFKFLKEGFSDLVGALGDTLFVLFILLLKGLRGVLSFETGRLKSVLTVIGAVMAYEAGRLKDAFRGIKGLVGYEYDRLKGAVGGLKDGASSLNNSITTGGASLLNWVITGGSNFATSVGRAASFVSTLSMEGGLSFFYAISNAASFAKTLTMEAGASLYTSITDGMSFISTVTTEAGASLLTSITTGGSSLLTAIGTSAINFGSMMIKAGEGAFKWLVGGAEFLYKKITEVFDWAKDSDIASGEGWIYSWTPGDYAKELDWSFWD